MKLQIQIYKHIYMHQIQYFFRNTKEVQVDQDLHKSVGQHYTEFVILRSQGFVQVLARLLIFQGTREIHKICLVDQQGTHEAHLMLSSFFLAYLNLHTTRYYINLMVHKEYGAGNQIVHKEYKLEISQYLHNQMVMRETSWASR